MKKLQILTIIYLVFPIILISQIREEIIKRHSNGEKELVITYKGAGNSEEIIRRVNYNSYGNKLSEENFNNGKRNGTFKVWNDLGHLIHHIEYKNDQRIEEIIYFEPKVSEIVDPDDKDQIRRNNYIGKRFHYFFKNDKAIRLIEYNRDGIVIKDITENVGDPLFN
jgi:hypothetical protein